MTTDRTITNPTADQLEAGGTASGTVNELLHFTNQELMGRGLDGRLELANHQPIIIDGWRNGRRFAPGVTVTSYTPPEPKPWWETCPDDAWIEANVMNPFSRIVTTAEDFRAHYADFFRSVGRRAEDSHPRRVHVSDYDSTVPVPRDALDKLRDNHRSEYSCSICPSVADFLRTVGGTGGA